MELQVVAVVHKGHEFAVLAVVADANDRSLGFLDDLNKSSNSASVSLTDSVNLVHDNDALLRREAADGSCKRVRIGLGLADAEGIEVVKCFVRAQVLDAAFNRALVTRVTRVLLYYFEAQLLAHNASGTCLADARRPA